MLKKKGYCVSKLRAYVRQVSSGTEIMMIIKNINDKVQLIEAIIRKL